MLSSGINQPETYLNLESDESSLGLVTDKREDGEDETGHVLLSGAPLAAGVMGAASASSETA